MAVFLDLPREIRDIIYSHSLIVEETLHLPQDAHFNSSQLAVGPATGLLTVSKAIRSETVPIILGSNTWRMIATFLHASNKGAYRLAPQRTNDCNHPVFTVLKQSLAVPFLELHGHLMRSVILDLRFERQLDSPGRFIAGLKIGPLDTEETAHAALLTGLLPSVESTSKSLALMPNLCKLELEMGPEDEPTDNYKELRRTQSTVLETLVEHILTTSVPRRLEVRITWEFSQEYQLRVMKGWQQQGLGRGRLFFGSEAIEEMNLGSGCPYLKRARKRS